METVTVAHRGVLSRIFTSDHQTIAKQYFFLSLASVLIGTLLSC